MNTKSALEYMVSEWGRHNGDVVTVFRDNISFQMQLDGRLTAYEECCNYASCNPGIIRIENENQEVLWRPQ